MAHYNMAVLHELQGKPEKALESYQKALSIKPDLPIAKRNLAFMQAAKGNYETAIDMFKEMMLQNPDSVTPYYYVAAIYSRQDKIDQSIHWLKKAVAKGYDDWENLQQDRNFNKIRNTSYYKKLMEDNSI